MMRRSRAAAGDARAAEQKWQAERLREMLETGIPDP